MMRIRVAAYLAVLSCLAATAAPAQEAESYLANVRVGGNVIGGPNGRVHLTFERWSSDEARNELLQTLVQSGGQALAEALRDTEPVGSIRVGTGTSYPFAYARSFTDGDLRRIVAVTDRPITGLEAVRSARTIDYDITLIELRFDATGKGEGVMMLGAEIVVDMRNRTLSVENFHASPVRLMGVRKP